MCNMNRFVMIVAWMLAGVASEALADEPPARELFVPFADLHLILNADTQRVFLSRQDYEALSAEAKAANRPGAKKQLSAILSAEYTAAIEQDRAQLVGTLVVVASDEPLSTLELDLSGISLRSALLDGEPAALGRNAAGTTVLFIRGAGQHELKLEMLAPLASSAAQRTLSFQIPNAASTRLRLTVDGNVEIQSGATVIRRTVDEAKPETAFDLLPRAGHNCLVLSLNNKKLQRDRVVVAHAVLVDQVTTAVERLQAIMSMSLLSGFAEQFRFEVPKGFEVISVGAPEVVRWAVSTADGKQYLEVQTRAPVSDNVSFEITAVRTPAALEDWHAPKLLALDVVSQSTVVGLFVEKRLKPSALVPKDLISIDAGILAQLGFQNEDGNPAGTSILSAVAAYYAPQASYDLSATFVVPPAELRALTNVLLTLEDKYMSVQGGFELTNTTDKLLGFDFTAPAGWQIIDVGLNDGVQPPLEFYPTEGGGSRVHVQFPQAAAMGQSVLVHFQGVSTPEGWLDEARDKSIAFPIFQVVGAASDKGAIAVQSRDDLLPRATRIDGLTPLDANERGKYGLQDVPADFAYRYDASPYFLDLSVTHVSPRMTARALSFFRVEPDLVAVHAELLYAISEGRTGRLSFALPAETPAEITIRGLDGVTLKESTSEVLDGTRLWTVQLAEPGRGTIRLALDFQQPLGDSPADSALPVVRALGVAYQSGTIAVEGSAEQDVQVKTGLRKADVGKLAEADYKPGRRLLGAFGYGGESAEVKLVITRPAGHELPSAIVERAELTTNMAANGRAQTAARFLLRAKAQMLEVKLPAGSILWSAYLDGLPTLPQREGETLLIDLPANAPRTCRDFQLVYESQMKPLGMSSTRELFAPSLLLRNKGNVTGTEVPLADLQWQLSTPNGYEVVRSHGTVYPLNRVVRPSPLVAVVRGIKSIFSGVSATRESVRKFRENQTRGPIEDTGMADKGTDADEGGRGSGREGGGGGMEGTEGQAVHNKGIVAGLEGAPASESGIGPPPAYSPGEMKGEGAAVGRGRRTPSPSSPGEGALDGEDDLFEEAPTLAFSESAPNGAFASPGSPPVSGAPPAKIPASNVAKSSAWALEGLRSLPIALQAGSNPATFQSLGESPRLSVTLSNRGRFELLAWAAGLVLFLGGIQLTGRTSFERFRYVFVGMVVGLALPLALPWRDWLGPFGDMAFFAALGLIPYYLALAVLKRLLLFGRATKQRTSQPLVTTAILGLLTLLGARHALADEPPAPLRVPADAIVVPYDPERENLLRGLDSATSEPFGSDKDRTILVPYSKYVELLKATQPDGKPHSAPPAEYALAGAAFRAQLDSRESLVIEGYVDIDVFVDHAVSIPIDLADGVLTKALIDGKSSAGIDLAPGSPSKGAEKKPDTQSLRLLVAGPGRRRLDLAFQFRLQKRGGWLIAEGRLPAAPAAALTLDVVRSGTEVTLSGGVDHRTIDTLRDHESIDTALADDGSFQLQWRDQVEAAPVDRSLMARSALLFDIQEDGLRLVTHYDLEFRGGQQEAFTIDVPELYLVESVAGTNVQGWRLVEADGRRQVKVTLLKSALETESFSITLSSRNAIGNGLVNVTVPVLRVEGAAQQSGEVRIRRSPLLELRTEQTAGVTRDDAVAPDAETSTKSDTSPLGILPYQAYRFEASPFTIRLSARAVTSQVRAELQTVIKVSERQRTLESRIRFRVQGRPIYRLRIGFPEEWKLDRVAAPEPFEWVSGNQGGSRVLSLYFASGQLQPFDVVLSGPLGDSLKTKRISLPHMEVLSADEQAGRLEQSGEIVIQADPSLTVQAENLKNCETEPLARANMWLDPSQQPLARLALRYRTPDYAAEIQLVPRQPNISCDTISNVRVTQNSVEETLLLDFHIEDAGIRELSFLLPESMRDARISAPMLQLKSIEPLADDPAKQVRVRLELQDEVMGNLRVLLENDRLMTGEPYPVPIPTVETGQTNHRYVTLESAGRDEILVTQQTGIDPLGREQAEWRMLTGILGRGLTQAFLVRQAETQPLLALQAKDRASVETAGARIGLAKATLVVDTNGAYRGEQLYRVNNDLEPYLEIRLPKNSQLWTAHVADEPVKPVAAKGEDTVRIPLVKTAPGDADYAVVLKYGGTMGPISTLDRVDLPLLRALNIHVELSQVELHMPTTHRWFNFGGTMRLVRNDGDLAAGWLAYNTKQIERALSSSLSGDEYSQARAKFSLKALQSEAQELKRQAETIRGNKQLDEQLKDNVAVQQGLTAIEAKEQSQSQTLEKLDNRLKLREQFSTQNNSRAVDVVNQAGRNFDASLGVPADSKRSPGDPQGQTLSEEWLSKHKFKKNELGEYARSLEGEPESRTRSSSSQLGSSANESNVYGNFQNAVGKGLDNRSGQATNAPKADEASERQLQRYNDQLWILQNANKPSVFSQAAEHNARGALASLTLDLHPRGVKYAFTTPRGEVEITAAAISSDLIERSARLAILSFAVLLGKGVRYRFGCLAKLVGAQRGSSQQANPLVYRNGT